MGLVGGVWVTRIPAVKQQAHLTDGLLGVALFAAPVGLIIGTTFAGRLTDRFGSARIASPDLSPGLMAGAERCGAAFPAGILPVGHVSGPGWRAGRPGVPRVPGLSFLSRWDGLSLVRGPAGARRCAATRW
jgi:hypothetical protein